MGGKTKTVSEWCQYTVFIRAACESRYADAVERMMESGRSCRMSSCVQQYSKVCVDWRGESGREGTFVCVCASGFLSHYPLTSSRSTGHHLSPARWPPACRQAPPASSFSTSLLSFLASLFSQSLQITKIMTTSFTSESLADLIYCTLWEGWSHLINANIIQITM